MDNQEAFETLNVTDIEAIEPIVVDMEINGYNPSMEVDTEALVTIISRAVLKAHFSEISL